MTTLFIICMLSLPFVALSGILYDKLQQARYDNKMNNKLHDHLTNFLYREINKGNNLREAIKQAGFEIVDKEPPPPRLTIKLVPVKNEED